MHRQVRLQQLQLALNVGDLLHLQLQQLDQPVFPILQLLNMQRLQLLQRLQKLPQKRIQQRKLRSPRRGPSPTSGEFFRIFNVIKQELNLKYLILLPLWSRSQPPFSQKIRKAKKFQILAHLPLHLRMLVQKPTQSQSQSQNLLFLPKMAIGSSLLQQKCWNTKQKLKGLRVHSRKPLNQRT